MMGDVINLRRVRKARDRGEAERAAEVARARHGRTSGQRAADKAAAQRLIDRIDQHKREPSVRLRSDAE